MKTCNPPQISDGKLDTINSNTGLCVFNREYKGDNYIIVKDGSTNIDTAFNYLDEQYDDIINKLIGSVLILGLGIGRGVIEACGKSDVKKIMVIEKDIRVINLFWELHGMGFDGVKKLSITEGDAINHKSKDYDSVFIDLYHPPINKKRYKKNMKLFRDRFNDTKVHFIDLY
jgi:hypothetical protein